MNTNNFININLSCDETELRLNYSTKIESIHCIVGKNGSGKTRLINDILTRKGEIACLSHSDIDKVSIIKYSGSVELEQPSKLPSNSIDVSTSSYLKNMNLIDLNRLDSIYQVDTVVSHYESLENIIDFSQKEIQIQLTQRGEGIKSFKKHYFHASQYSDVINEFITGIFKSRSNTNITNISKILVMKFLSLFMDSFILTDNWEDDNLEVLRRLFKQIDLKTIRPNSRFYKILEDKFGYSENNEKIIELKNFFEMFITFIELETNIFDLSKRNREILQNVLRMITNPNSKNTIAEEVFSIIEFKWSGLSSGELAILNLLARLNSQRNLLNSVILILIDEIDLGLHPEWQRRWVKDVLPIIGSILKTEDNSIHIIFTTHSPVILSDFLEKDIIYLSHEIDIIKFKTFGQNIYSLFQNSFYLKNPKGSFSTDVIRHLLSILDRSSADQRVVTDTDEYKQFSQSYNLNLEAKPIEEVQKFFKDLVNMIGEDIIRNHLKIKLENIKWYSEDDLILEYRNKIEKYQRKIERLEESKK